MEHQTKTKKLHPEFKAKVVLEARRGESSQAEVCRKPYNPSTRTRMS